MDLEELKVCYERLFELTEDGTEFRYFKSKKEYRHQKEMIRSAAERLGCLKEFDNYVRYREFDLYMRYDLRKGLSGHRVRSADDYDASAASFLWYPYIPSEEYTVLMAAGGTGKTYLTCGIAAFLSRGTVPLGNPEEEQGPQNVLFISGEDKGGELRVRLEASGADLEKIYVIDCVESEGLSLSEGIDEFGYLIARAQAKLVVIDPWQAFIGRDVDVNRVNILRPVLQSISNLAKRKKCAIILVSHVGKKIQADNINNAAIGSTDLINASRSVLAVAFADEKNERLMIHTKSNYSEPGQTILFAISQTKGIEWKGYSDVDRRAMEAAVRMGKSAPELMRERREEREALEPLANELRLLAVPGKKINVTYDQLRETLGEDVFLDMQPMTALGKALALIPTSGISIRAKQSIRVPAADGQKSRVRRGFELYRRARPGTEKNVDVVDV
ncbi:MAG: AAA family ATPase [Clostridia bacterium]|nr:AAA family ATPase [Clostridia bacterium]